MDVMNRPASIEALERLSIQRPSKTKEDPKKQTQKKEIQKKYIRPKDAAEMYSVSRTTVLKWAADAGALLPMEGCKLIDPVVLDKYLENWRVPAKVYY